ncbi:MAG: hypothetical protein MUP11_06035 [Anaerolineales bacterium]|nr:hypothetical protein [Anaerolineales bacterium]
MSVKNTPSKKSLFINLFLFYIVYFALILGERQLVRKGYLGFTLPFEMDILKSVGFFVLGSILVVGITMILVNQQWILRFVLTASLLLGAIYINYFLYHDLYYLPFFTTAVGDLDALGRRYWQRDYAFEMYSAVYGKYYQHTIIVNPDINNYKELSRIQRFGVYIKQSEIVPAMINQETFSRIEESGEDDYLGITKNNIEYRLYEVGINDDIILTTYNGIILFLPSELIAD